MEPKTENVTQFQPGDIVRIRSDLVIGDTYFMNDGETSDAFVKSMYDYRGKDLVISSITSYGKYHLQTLNGGAVYCNWTDEMFEQNLDPLPDFPAEDISVLYDFCIGKSTV